VFIKTSIIYRTSLKSLPLSKGETYIFTHGVFIDIHTTVAISQS